MYQLTHPIETIAGIGPTTAEKFSKKGLRTVQDLLLWVPLRYEDRSTQKKLMDLVVDELVTVKAEVTSVSNQYRGRKSIQRATVRDNSGSLKLIWFNSPYIVDTLKKGQEYFISGKLNSYGQMSQPKVEKVSEDTIHTNRLVPVYSAIPGIKQGNIRRFLKEIIDHLGEIPDPLPNEAQVLGLTETFQHLHFPDEQQLTIQARQRLALEELLGLMRHSADIKKQWKANSSAPAITINEHQLIPAHIPFTLTNAQIRSVHQILFDLQSSTPMNRLLLGDVGSGKTVVAGIAAQHVLDNKNSVVFIVPTQILAEQHANTLAELFPQSAIQLVTAQQPFAPTDQPTLFVGTHALINQLSQISPALIIYDEQHRFGVNQRSEALQLDYQPHLLTMSATPIPRSLMLTIFSHLQLSLIDELPAGRKPVRTWVVPEHKRHNSYQWIKDQLATTGGQVLIVCPFINPSEQEGFTKVAAATDLYETISANFPGQKVGLLHGQMKRQQQEQVITQLFAKQIDLLVTTPIVEVGVDLPTASIMVIESAERFGLASLHQLRGRVGRAGQQAYCLLFTNSHSADTLKRLKVFTETTNGMKLAEFDLTNRGAGDLFGTEQHGFDQLRFASWTNTELIAQAREIFENHPDYNSQLFTASDVQNVQAN